MREMLFFHLYVCMPSEEGGQIVTHTSPELAAIILNSAMPAWDSRSLSIPADHPNP